MHTLALYDAAPRKALAGHQVAGTASKDRVDVRVTDLSALHASTLRASWHVRVSREGSDACRKNATPWHPS